MAQLEQVTVPEIGDFDDVEVVEVLVAAGDRVEKEQSLITLESEKASMEVPSPVAGTVRELKTKVGAKVRQGSLIAVIEADRTDRADRTDDRTDRTDRTDDRADRTDRTDDRADRTDRTDDRAEPTDQRAHASPSVRRLAGELGVDLARVTPSGRKGRVLAADVHHYVKAALAQPAGGATVGLPPLPDFDPAKFGPVEVVPLSKINKLAARNLHRSWLHIPHVTHNDEADITDLEAFRRAHAADADGVKLTFVSFVVRAAASALLRFPRFNSSLLAGGEKLALRRYVNMGVAVDTADGLVVPVIRDAADKGLRAIAAELAELSARARDGKLTPQDMQGATFTISSLGGIGGTSFTPIVNGPEVAILGISRAQMRPVFRDGAFVPRLILPVSLSYDHRVIDGAAAARFTRHLCELLEDLRTILL